MSIIFGKYVWLFAHLMTKTYNKYCHGNKKISDFVSEISVYNGADYGARTRHLDLGKVALYQMS